MDSVYAGFLKAAELHYKTQQTSKVEYFAAKARCQELTVKIKQSESNYRASLARLNQYIGIPGMFGIADDENDHAELLKNVLPADSLKQRAVLEYYNNEVAVTKAAWKKEQENYLPKIDLGYSMQSVDGQSGFYSWEAGVSVPLLFFSQTGKTRAARLDYEIAEQNLRQKELEVYATCQELFNRFNTQREILKYYITQALPLAKEQIKAASLEYKLGNINYIQFLENVETSMKTRQEYLTSFMEYHTIEEQLKYITGK
jgi:cobalt-zinc-cadmium resistance protein CzcA